MTPRSRTLLLIVLVPAALYGLAKGLLYYNAKQTVDGIVDAAAGEAVVSYEAIGTELTGAVSVHGIDVRPHGSAAGFSIDRVRVASGDPHFLLRGGDWRPGSGPPPSSLSLEATNITLPVDGALPAVPATPADSRPGAAAGGPCADGLQVAPELLRAMGLAGLGIDAEGSYRLDEERGTLEFGMMLDLRDVQSVHLDATLTDVDTGALAQGAAPNLNLGRLTAAVRVSPAFGARALEACAEGSGDTPAQWGERLASRSIEQYARAGLDLGPGLRQAVRDFYREWGEVRVVAAPARPLGLLSLMFLSPEQLVQALGPRLSLNGRLVTDTSFSWRREGPGALAALIGGGDPRPAAAARAATAPPRGPAPRAPVRRAYETVAVDDLSGLVDQRVRLKPRGMPAREGVLRRVVGGIAEVEQSLHGGHYTAYVPLDEIESAEALVRRGAGPAGGRPDR